MEDTPAVDGGLNPAQVRVLDELMARREERPRFGPEVAARLRAGLEEAVTSLVDGVAEDAEDADAMWVTKGSLGQVHACEAHFNASAEEGFAWNAANAKGTVAHRALELSVTFRGDPAPLELVDHALDSIGRDERRNSPRTWLESATPVEVADLRAAANDVVAKFLECWPRLPARWAPRSESGIGAELCDGRVVLWGRVDLLLGRAEGDVAKVLVVDLKTGRAHSSHLDDLRFYALVQTLRVGVPPFRVASYYLDTATFHHEDVTVDMLHLAVRRAVDGIAKMAELRAGREPAITPGPQCGWCSLATTCDGPARWRETRGDPTDLP